MTYGIWAGGGRALARLVAALALLCAWAAPARAALPDVPGTVFPLSGEATAVTDDAGPERPMTLAVNLAPLVCVTGELRWEVEIGPAWSWSLLAGMGRGRATGRVGWVAEGGAQLRWYMSGSFRKGLFLAAEGNGLLTFGEGSRGEDAAGIGPRLGFKTVGRWGLTIEGHVGASYVRKTTDGFAPGSEVVATEVQPVAAVLVGLTW